MVYDTKKKFFTNCLIIAVVFLCKNNCIAQSVHFVVPFPNQFWNHSEFIGNGTTVLGSAISQLPNSVFEKEHTGFENTVNSFYRLSLVAGVILPLSSVIANGNSAISYYRQHSNGEVTFSNPFQFWNNSPVFSKIQSLNYSNEIEKNFLVTSGYNHSIFLRNSISKNTLHRRNSSIVESAVLVSTAIAQFRPFLNNQFFSGSNEYSLDQRFLFADSSKSSQEKRRFQSISTINFLNPLLWTSLYHTIFSYPFKGKSTQQTPFIRLTRTVTYLPYFDVLLAPYGAEVQMTNVFTNQNQQQATISFRLASTENDNPFSVGLELKDIKISNEIYSGGSIELWNQPKDFSDAIGQIGGQVMVDVIYDVYSNENALGVGIRGGLGYKSFGFSSIPSLQESFFVHAGISLRNLP